MKNNGKRDFLSVLILLTCLILVACGGQSSTSSNADGENNDGIDDSITIATHPTGTGQHAVAAGFAALISDETPITAVARPTAGPAAWMNDLAEGRVQFGMIPTPDASFAYRGIVGYEQPVEGLRMVLAGMPTYNMTLAVKKESDITSLKDLKGRRVVGGMGGNHTANLLIEIVLESAGLTKDDIQVVNVPDFLASLDALQDGSLEVAYPGAPTSSKAVEVASVVGGLRGLPIGDLKPEDIENGIPAEIEELLRTKLPTASLAVMPAGLGWLEEDTVHIKYDLSLATHESVSEETVYTVLKAIWDHHDRMHNVHVYSSELTG